jgi:hypothetical protein
VRSQTGAESRLEAAAVRVLVVRCCGAHCRAWPCVPPLPPRPQIPSPRPCPPSPPPHTHAMAVRALSCFLEPVLFCNMAEDRWPILYVNQRFTQAIGAPLTGSSTSAGPCCPCTVTTGPGSDH